MIDNLLSSLAEGEDLPLLTWNSKTTSSKQFLELVTKIGKNLNRANDTREKWLIDISEPDIFYSTFFAVIQSGHIAVLPNKDYLERDYVFPFIHGVLKWKDGHLEKIQSNVDAEVAVPENVDCIIFSSGSTGTPKGICHPFENLIDNTRGVSKKVKYSKSFIPLKPYLVSALAHFLGHMDQKAHLIFIPENTSLAEFAELSEQNPNTGLVGSPIHLARYATSFSNHSTAPYFFSSGDFIFASTIERILEHHPKAIFYKVYGIAEVGGRFFVNTIKKGMSEAEVDAIGDPIDRTSFEIVEDEIQVNSDFLFAGYVIGSEFKKAQRPFPSGDLATKQNGYLALAGRVSDEIKIGGQKFHLSQLNKKIITSFDENSFALVPKPHPLFGNLLCFVTQNPALTRSALQTQLGKVLQKSELPQEYYFAEKIPRTGSGKLDRKQTIMLLEGLKKLT